MEGSKVMDAIRGSISNFFRLISRLFYQLADRLAPRPEREGRLLTPYRRGGYELPKASQRTSLIHVRRVEYKPEELKRQIDRRRTPFPKEKRPVASTTQN